MTNLPDDLQSLLDLARDAHDPVDPTARARVRYAITASLAVGASSAGALGTPSSTLQQGLTNQPLTQASASNTQALGGAAQTGKVGWSLFGSKLGTIALTTVAAAGIGLAVYATRSPSVSTRSTEAPAAITAAPVVAPVVAAPAERAPEPEVPAQVALPNEPAAPTAAVAKSLAPANSKPVAARGDTLTAEIALLRGASEALSRNDAVAALAVLQKHARQFPQGSLREERDGLRAIAECSRPSAPSSASAHRFARLYPESLMRARIAKACDGKTP